MTGFLCRSMAEYCSFYSSTGKVGMSLRLHLNVTNKHADTYTNTQRLTCEVISRPGAQFTGSAGVLVEHKLIFFTGGAGPAAAHLTFTDHLEGTECTMSVSSIVCCVSCV